MFKVLFRTKQTSPFEKNGGRMSGMYYILLFLGVCNCPFLEMVGWKVLI